MNPGQTLRAFIAIELDPKVQAALGQIQKELKDVGADVKWVKPDNIHLTLKFLGDVSLEELDSIKGAMQTTLQPIKSFSMALTHLGAFPKVENPQIIWVGATADKNSIKSITESLEENLKGIGFEKEKRDFEPHITLGRMRSSDNKFALSKKIKNFQFPAGAPHQLVNQIALFKSTLTPQGPIYETLAKINLK